jgi:parvulin-like peptidyl-prolyl isomerase
MKKLLKEPLLHFFLLGGLLFAINAWRQKPVTNSPARIEITAAVIERLRAGYERQFGQPPDTEELRGLVAQQIREEVLYREALTLGLDRYDTIVRRRLAQKMEFLTDDILATEQPNDAELERFFTKNAARYAKPPKATFRQIYFSQEKRGATAETAAREALAALCNGASDERFGDAFLHGFEFVEREPGEIAALFGKDFAAQLATQPTDQWRGPLSSSYGVHLVRVERRTQPQPVGLADVRDAVLRDFTEERRRSANSALFEKLRERYEVIVDESAFNRTAAVPAKVATR